MSAGLTALDADMDAVMKITDKDNQVVKMVSSDGTFIKTNELKLNGLTLED